MAFRYKAFAKRILGRLPLPVAMRLAQTLLRSQGFGAGGGVSDSGEQGVFDRVTAEAPVLFDVGGFVGAYSAAFLSRFPGGKAFLFEPSLAHMIAARRTLADHDVTFFEVALSDADTTATLYKDTEISGLASLTRRRLDHFDTSLDLEEPVRCRTLDSMLPEIGADRIDLLKLDVEGHELAVLNGARGAIETGLLNLIQFEFGGCNLDTRTTFQDLFYFFSGYGFTVHIVHPSGRLIPLRAYSEAYEQYVTTNYVAARDPAPR